MKTFLFTTACLLIMAISGLTGWWLKAVQPRPVPTIEWVQEKVGAKVDGKLCRSWNVPGHVATFFQQKFNADRNTIILGIILIEIFEKQDK